MNIEELKALADKLQTAAGRSIFTDVVELIAQLEDARAQMERQKDEWLSWEAKRRNLEKAAAQLEDAQGEIRALLVNEQNLRERVKELEDGIRDAAVLADFAEMWITDPAIEGMRRLDGGGKRFLALLEKQK